MAASTSQGSRLPLHPPLTSADEDDSIAGLAERLAQAMLEDGDGEGDLFPSMAGLGSFSATWEASRLRMLAEARKSSPTSLSFQQQCHSPAASSTLIQPECYSSCCQQGLHGRASSFSPPPPSTWNRVHQIHSLAEEADHTMSACQLGASKPELNSDWAPQVGPVQLSHISAACRNGQNAKSGHWLCNLASETPAMKPAVGMGMRAIFLGSKGSGREPSGTGVFLPRVAGNSMDSKKKPPSSTVLLPLRVVQALNLNVENMQPFAIGPSGALLFRPIMHAANTSSSKEDRYLPSSPPTVSDSLPRVFFQPASKVDWVDSELRHSYPIQLQSSQVDLEASLPTEWIY